MVEDPLEERAKAFRRALAFLRRGASCHRRGRGPCRRRACTRPRP